MTELEKWIATLDDDQRQTAIAAGLDAPLDDSSCGRNHELRQFDGLQTFRKNGSLHPVEKTTDHSLNEENEDLQTDPRLAAALRRILQWIVGGETAASMFENSRTLAARIFILARCLRINDCDKPSLAAIAAPAGYSRAALSKIAVAMRDQFGVPNLTPQSREAHRGTARQATLNSWEQRKKKTEG